MLYILSIAILVRESCLHDRLFQNYVCGVLVLMNAFLMAIASILLAIPSLLVIIQTSTWILLLSSSLGKTGTFALTINSELDACVHVICLCGTCIARKHHQEAWIYRNYSCCRDLGVISPTIDRKQTPGSRTSRSTLLWWVIWSAWAGWLGRPL